MANLGRFGAIHCIFSVLIIATNMQNFTFINIKFYCHFSDQLTNVLRLDWNCIFLAVVVTLLVIFVSLANFDILQVGPFINIIDINYKKNGTKY